MVIENNIMSFERIGFYLGVISSYVFFTFMLSFLLIIFGKIHVGLELIYVSLFTLVVSSSGGLIRNILK